VSAVHALAFGDAQLWGAVWAKALPGPARLAVGSAGSAHVLEVELGEAGETWRLEGETASLVLVAEDTPTPASTALGELRSADRLCSVSGTLRLDDDAERIEARGWRSRLESSRWGGEIDSVRQLAGWFAPAQGFAVAALRPRRARGQEGDLLAACLLEDHPGATLTDPRLSTTYDREGRPLRAGVEFWLEQEREADADQELGAALPRRAIGEASAPGIEWRLDEVQLYARPFRWYSRGETGNGVYLLGSMDR